MLIHPKNLPVVTDAWKLLTWSVQEKEVQVRNTSPYVVRFSTSVTLLPSHTEGVVNKTFILPGETMKVQTNTPIGSGDNAVEFNLPVATGLKWTSTLPRLHADITGNFLVILRALQNTMRRTAVAVAFLPSSALYASDLDFNTDILASRGISTNLAHYFSDAQRYLPGQHAVQVKINGVEKGSLAIRVGEEGQLCIDDDFTRAAGLLPLNIGEKREMS